MNILKPEFTKSMARVGRISYLNVAPVYYGFDTEYIPAWMKIFSAPPAVLNHMLEKEELDISPVSSAAYAKNCQDWLLLPDLSISCFGKVMSVIFVSQHPFEELDGKKITLTKESATAAELLKLLFAIRNVKPAFKTGVISNPEAIANDAAAALVIGDAALKYQWNDCFQYVWDLGDMWLKLTGLPFVFAVWAVRRSFAEKQPEIVSSLIDSFHLSKRTGIQNISKILPLASQRLGISSDTCREYYRRLHYDLDSAKIKGLENFFDKMFMRGMISHKVQLDFFDNRVKWYRTERAA